MNALRKHVRLIVLAAVGLSTAVLPPAAAAEPGHLASGRVTSTISVVASGLNAPRGLVYDASNRRVLVAEAGIKAGNTGPCGLAERDLPMCFGRTGSIYQYSINGARPRRIVTGLPSTALQDDDLTVIIGLHDITLSGGRIAGVFGTLGNKPYRESLGSAATLLGQAVAIDLSGRVRPVADILTFIDERYRPDRVEANPFGVAVGRYGMVVANAGGPDRDRGNNLLLVNRDGEITELAQFPERPAQSDPETLIRAVPTTVAQGPDGAFYVGELTGAPFIAGEARIWRVVPGQRPTVHQRGFSTVIDIAFDSRGRLIVLQTSGNPFDSEQDGKLIRVEPNGSRTVLASTGLTNPGGVALANDNTFYVTTRTATGGGVGQLVKVTLT